MNFKGNIISLFILCFSFNVLQASSSEKMLQESTKELIDAVENATIDEGLVVKTAECKQAEQKNIDRLRTKVAKAAIKAGKSYNDQKIIDQVSKLSQAADELAASHDKTIGAIQEDIMTCYYMLASIETLRIFSSDLESQNHLRNESHAQDAHNRLCQEVAQAAMEAGKSYQLRAAGRQAIAACNSISDSLQEIKGNDDLKKFCDSRP